MMIKVKDLFETSNGNGFALSEMQITKSGCNFVARGEKNNGIVAQVQMLENIIPFQGNKITVALSGSVMESFFQEQPFYTAYHIKVLTPKQPLTKKEMLFYCMILRSNKYRYCYGRQANRTLENILIPPLNELPAWVNDISMPKEPSKKPYHKKIVFLQDREWNWFNIQELFHVKGSKSHTKESIKLHPKGKYPFVVTSSINNGIEGFYDHYTEDGGVLTIDSATVGSCFYQTLNFSASDHVEKLVPLFAMNDYVALFLTTIVNIEKFRYGYGRKFAQTRIKRTKIKLPVTSQGEPDWAFMEYYIKSLIYSSNLK